MASVQGQNHIDRLDRAMSIIRQRNSCPICHLPLCYGIAEPPDGAAPTRSSDWNWHMLQQVVKHVPPKLNDNDCKTVYGRNANKVNAEKCHLVHHSMVPEITRPALFFTPLLPAGTNVMYTDPGYYLFDAMPHTALFHWNMPEIVRVASGDFRRSTEFLTTSGAHFFIACRDCNISHTGDAEMGWVFRQALGYQLDTQINDVYIMYTLLFDCMADAPSLGPATPIRPVITYDAMRAMRWQLELWMNYRAIMFLSQQAKSHEYGRATHRRMLHMAHKDMGLCDFYMSKMLAALLYAQFAIDIDFVWLHQNFLSLLAIWAKQEGVYHTTDIDFGCLWRWVMGTPASPAPLAPRTDPSVAAGGGGYQFIANNPDFYWVMVTDVPAAARRIQASVTEFAKSWLVPIGQCIQQEEARYTAYEGTLDATQQPIARSLRRFFLKACRPAALHRLTLMSTQEDLLIRTIYGPSLHAFESCFQDATNEAAPPAPLFPSGYLPALYDNYIMLAFARTRCAMDRVVQRSRASRNAVTDLEAKFRRMVFYVDQWLDGSPSPPLAPFVQPPRPPPGGGRGRGVGGRGRGRGGAPADGGGGFGGGPAAGRGRGGGGGPALPLVNDDDDDDGDGRFGDDDDDDGN
jgi:hypothetical protein